MATLSQDQAIEKLFTPFLDALAYSGRFSDPDSQVSFVVYAHDPDVDNEDGLGTAHSGVVKKFLEWMHRIRTRTFSDQYPSGTFEQEIRTNGDAGCRNILENQFCLLPPRQGHVADLAQARTERVDLVIVCGSQRLRSYCEDPFARTYIDSVKRIYEENRAASDSELREQLHQKVLDTEISKSGFHHVLTEIAFLELRCQYGADNNHGIVLVNLEQRMMDYLKFTQQTDLQLTIDSSSSSTTELHGRFFKLLKVMYPKAHAAIDRYQKAYKSAAMELGRQDGDITERRLDDLIDKFISPARRDLWIHLNEELRQFSLRFQLVESEKASFTDSTKRRNEVLGKLPTLPLEDYKKRIPDRIEGTCRWFTRHAKFTQWQQSESPGILWVTALPGCGKSVLLKYLVDTVLVAPNTAICYFFFKDDFDNQKSLVSALRCLLHQVFIRRPELFSATIVERFEQNEQLYSSASELWDLLDSATREVTVGNVVVVIDALDECRPEDQRLLMRQLVEWSENATTTRLKVLVSSRPYSEIQSGFRKAGPEIHLSGESDTELEHISAEIELVIMHELREATADFYLDEEQENILREELTKFEHKTYLWAYLVQKQIKDILVETDPESLRAAVRKLPPNAEAEYEKILSRSRQRHKMMKMLSIIIAATRPFSLLELAQAWVTTPEVSTASELRIPSDEEMKRTLSRLCGLFVIVAEGKVYLLHQTAREFLLANTDETGMPDVGDNANPWKGSVVMVEAQFLLAQICLRHFELHEAPAWGIPTYEPVIRWDKRMPGCRCVSRQNWNVCDCFARYATKEWVTHILAAQDAGGQVFVQRVGNMIARLCGTYRWRPISALAIASWLGLLPLVDFLSQSPTADLESVDGKGNTALGWAVDFGHVDVVRVLLERGANCHIEIPPGHPILTHAAMRGHHAVIDMLIEHGTDINSKNEEGRTALHEAVKGMRTQTVILLLGKGADCDAAGQSGMTPLMDAGHAGFSDGVLLLLEHGANIDAVDQWGVTAFAHACRCDLQTARVLLDKGADPSLSERDGTTPLMRCCMRDDSNKPEQIGTMELLLQDPRVHINVENCHGDTALSIAIRRGDKPVVQWLLERGATINHMCLLNAASTADDTLFKMALDACAHDVDINTVGPYGQTILTVASAKGNKTVVEQLLRKGVNIHHLDIAGQSALYKAAESAFADIVQILLSHSAELPAAAGQVRGTWREVQQEEPDTAGWCFFHDLGLKYPVDTGHTPFTIVASHGNPYVMARFLDTGQQVDVTGLNGRTALYEAAYMGHLDIVKLLLDHGADVNRSNHDGATPLIAALWGFLRGREEIVRLLLSHDADAEHITSEGYTALSAAVFEDDVEAVELLLDHGANLNHCDTRAIPALHLAAKRGHSKVVRLLIDRGADPARKYSGMSALDKAIKHGHLQVVKLLLPVVHDVALVQSALIWNKKGDDEDLDGEDSDSKYWDSLYFDSEGVEKALLHRIDELSQQECPSSVR